MKEILRFMNYKTYKWHICHDMKVIAILVGLQKFTPGSIVSEENV